MTDRPFFGPLFGRFLLLIGAGLQRPKMGHGYPWSRARQDHAAVAAGTLHMARDHVHYTYIN